MGVELYLSGTEPKRHFANLLALEDESCWDRYQAWITQRLVTMERVLRPVVKDLPSLRSCRCHPITAPGLLRPLACAAQGPHPCLPAVGRAEREQ